MPPRKAQPKTKPPAEPEAEPVLAEDPAPEIPAPAPDPPPPAVAPARTTPMTEEELKRHMQNLLASGPATPPSPPAVADRTSSVVYLDESMNSFVLDLARRLGWTKQDVIQGCIAFVRQDTQTRGLMYTEVALGRAYQPKK